jgi:hypothetical protein
MYNFPLQKISVDAHLASMILSLSAEWNIF